MLLRAKNLQCLGSFRMTPSQEE